MAKGYQFNLNAVKLTKGAVVYRNPEEELCNTLYLRKGIVKLMGEVFPNGMPRGITITIQENPDAPEVDVENLPTSGQSA